MNFNRQFSWPNDATLTLIERRRHYQGRFASTAINLQRHLWERIATDINTQHVNFAPTRRQCRTKWNSLKKGYENLKRLINGNPNRFPTHTPSLHDERFHQELSDEFWLTERNYLLLINFFIN